MTYDLLNEPLLRVSAPGEGLLTVDLPGALARLCAGQDLRFVGLRPHQEHAWYALLAQLAAVAAGQAGLGPRGALPEEAELWRSWLEALTPGQASAWSLVEAELSRPAFLQAPMAGAKLSELGEPMRCPDQLDILVLAKNHDLKSARARRASPELWLYALVTLQTMEGYGGKGNYGVARMNGGLGNRPLMGAARSLSWGQRLRRDLPLMLDDRARLLGDEDYDRAGPALLWLQPWDGKESLPLKGLHPWFVEICRRVRLVEREGALQAHSGTSAAARLQSKERLGNVGDPWTPVDKEGKSLTLPAAGFTYKRVADLLSGAQYTAPLLGQVRRGDRLLLLAAMVRGQGKTEGFHERVVLVDDRLSGEQWRDRVARMARDRIALAGELKLRALGPALRLLLQGGDDQKGAPGSDPRIQRFFDGFEAGVDQGFFGLLWRHAEVDPDSEEAEALQARDQAEWERFLFDTARAQLDLAIATLPLPLARSYKGIAVAERIFVGSSYKILQTHPMKPPRADGVEEQP